MVKIKILKNRIEAFSDGVIAIIVTIIVLNIPLPSTFDAASILAFTNSIVTYLVSFLVVGNFWNQHRRLFDDLEYLGNEVIWLNILFLFFLSLVPLFTKWVIQNPNAVVPAVGYGITFLCINLSLDFMFLCLLPSIIQKNAPHFYLRMFIMPTITLIIIFLTFFHPRVSTILFIGLPVSSAVLSLVFDENQDGHRRRKIK